PDRGAFPAHKKQLVEQAPHGQEIFDAARQALLDIGQYNSTYEQIARRRPNSFCHGFGIFQYDIQFCEDKPGYDPAFFRAKKWYDFSACLEHCLKELRGCADYLFPHKTSLTDEEMVYVAIGYNIGPRSVRKNGGFKQGHRDGGKYYGEYIWEYLQIAKTIAD